MNNREEMPGKPLSAFKNYPEDLEHFPHSRALDRIANLSSGISAALEIINADKLNENDAGCFGRVLNENQRGALLVLALEASNVIADKCSDAFEWAQKHGMDGVKRYQWAREQERAP